MRPKIYFIVKYIAALKYYEKILPHLRNKYEVGFLLLADRGMIGYCEEKSLKFHTLFLRDTANKTSKLRVPFVSHIRDQNQFLKECDKFLASQKPAKLVSVLRINFPVQAIFAKANALGIETIALQWALQFPKSKNKPKADREWHWLEVAGGACRKIYYFILAPILNFLYSLSSGLPCDTAAHNAKKIGVMSEAAKNAFIEAGYGPEEKFAVVGNAEFQNMHELARKVNSDPSFKDCLLGKYNLQPGKLNILVISTFFYLGKTVKFTDRRGQIKYFRNIFELIRRIFPKGEADILFKLHPKEENIYRDSYEDLGVKIFTKEAMTDELISLSGLYIAHPGTSANFMLLASGKPAIFINFTPLDFLNEGARYYNIKNIAAEPDEFLRSLKKFRDKKLELQYENKDIELDSINKIVAFLES
ncbi:MAG: hypothetical protein GXP44_02730 [bacterium]|nr:hypothetical protein [bacterium]